MNINKLYSTIDTQVLGEAFRIVIQSPIRFTAGSLLEKQQQLHRDFTKEKQLFLNEPRGHRGINGCMVLPSSTASYELLFFNHPDSAAFKLEGVLASLTALLETGNIAEEDNHAYTIHTAYGEYVVKAAMHHQQVTAITVDTEQSITLQNQEHSIYSIDDDQKYATRFLPEHIPSIHIDHMSDIEIWGSSELEKLKQNKQLVEGLLLIEAVNGNHVRTVTFEKDGYIRRTPGIVSSNVLIQALGSSLDQTKPIKNETIFGSTLITEVDPSNANKVAIRPFVTGMQDFVLDTDDPLPTGFLLK